MPKKILDLSCIQIGEDESTLFKTNFFHVTVNRDNQAVSGILKITTTYEPLNNWNNWENKHWVELLQIIRLCELTLIKAFEPNREHNLRPTLDDKLINCYGKNRRTNEKSIIYFDIVPRYKERIQLRDLLSLEKSEVSEEELEPFKKDNLYGKPFNFGSPIKPSDKIYNSIVKKLLATINQNDFSIWLLEDSFGIKDNCIACGNIIQHPHKTGIAEVAGFKIALDARSQEERGRAFCDTVMHIPALRYWEDELIVDAGKIFSAYRATVNSLYKADGGREFDWMCLMNLAKEQEGPHTHIHFIPRTPDGKDYGRDFLMDISTYKSIEEVAIFANTTKAAIVEEFRKKFNENLKKEGLMIESEHDERELLEKIDKMLNDISKYKSDDKQNRLKKATAHGFVLNYVKCIKSTKQFEEYRKKTITQLSETLYDILIKDYRQKYTEDKQQGLFEQINSFVISLYGLRDNKEVDNKTLVNALEEKIQSLFNYCFHVLGYKNIFDNCSVLILGSFATGVATLYSDIEYFILTNKKEYEIGSCRRASFLFNIIIQSLGENKELFKKMNIKDIFNEKNCQEIENYAKKGLSIDVSKNPFTEDLYSQFIDTPEGLLTRLIKSDYKRNESGNHTTSALLTTKLLCGNGVPYNQYKKMFIDYLLEKKYFYLIDDFLEEDLRESRELYELLHHDEKIINLKKILANIIHIIRQLYLLHESHVHNGDLQSNFFAILDILKYKFSIEENRYNKWKALIENIYRIRFSLQSEHKSAYVAISVANLKKRLNEQNIETILKDISDFVKSKLDEINNMVIRYDLVLMSTLLPKQQLEQGKLYLKYENNIITYKVLNNTNEEILGYITANDISDGVVFPTNDNLEQFSQIKKAILKVTYNRGHVGFITKSEFLLFSSNSTRPEKNTISTQTDSIDSSFPKTEENIHDFTDEEITIAKLQNNLGDQYYDKGRKETDDRRSPHETKDNKNYKRAFELYSAAVKYYPTARLQFSLGSCFYNGYGVEQDYRLAVEWYTKAALQGEAEAQNVLGNCYKKGKGQFVTQNLDQAIIWFTKAASQNHAAAQYNLAACYQKGESVTRNYREAVYWYTEAANQNHHDAQYYLGLCYEKGFGVAVDLDAAIKWYTEAAKNTHAQANQRLKEKFDKNVLSLKH